MIEFTWKELNNPIFQQGMRKLYHASSVSAKTGFWIAKIVERIELEREKMRAQFVEIHTKYKVWDNEKQSVKVDDQGKPLFETADLEREHDLECEKMLDTTVRAGKLQPIHVDKLGDKTGLTPIEIAHMSHFLGGLPEIDVEDDSEVKELAQA